MPAFPVILSPHFLWVFVTPFYRSTLFLVPAISHVVSSPVLNSRLPFNAELVQQFHHILPHAHSCIRIHTHTHKYTHTWQLQHLKPDIFCWKRNSNSHTSREKQNWYLTSRLVDSQALTPFISPPCLSFFLFNTKNNNSTYIILFFNVLSHICSPWQAQLLWKVGQVILFSLRCKRGSLA